MKVTAAILLGLCLQVSATGISQTITFSGKDVSLKEIISAIKKQTGLRVVYSNTEVRTANPVTIAAQNTPYQEFLTLIFSNQPLTFDVDGKTIFIRKKEITTNEGLNPGLDGEGFSRRSFPLPPITVRGRILNEKGEPVIGSVIIKGTNRGTTSNPDGFFELAGVDEKAILIFSGANIDTKEVSVEGRVAINVSVSLKISMEEEVVIKTNYWETKKRLSTSNISKVTAKEINNQPVTSPLLALQGRVPGLEIIMPPNAVPGVAPKIRIRGVNSLRTTDKVNSGPFSPGALTSANNPLYVIDGIPVSSNSINARSIGLSDGGFDPLSTINPENIASIEILKDADGTAIYGARGANGVILITTKMGILKADRTNIDASIYSGLGKVAQQLDLLNTEQYLMMRREAKVNEGLQPGIYDYDLIYWDPIRSTDWQEVLTGGTANITDAQFSVSGGNQNTTFRIGAGFHKETLVFPGDFSFARPAIQVSIQHFSKNKKFRISHTSNFGYSKNRLFEGSGGVSSRLTLAPNAPRLYNDDGTLNWELHEINGKMTSTWINPLSYLLNTLESTDNNQVANFTIGYELFPGLSIQTSAGYSNLVNSTLSKAPVSNLPPDIVNRIPSINFTSTKIFTWIIEPQITYSTKLNSHSINLILGSSWQRNTNEYKAGGAEYTSEAFMNSLNGANRIYSYDDIFSEYKYASVYGRIGYNWNEKYLINLTGRRDGSSRFGLNNQFGNFGAIGAGWIISEEKWLEHLPSLLTFVKLRGSYGITGSDAVADYSFYDLYNILGRSYDGVPGAVPASLFNPQFFWESTRKLEVAIELGFWDNRVNTEISWYRNRSSDQLVDFTLPEITGFPFVLSNFGAVVQNTGFEAALHGIIVKTNKLKWDISFNVSLPKNKLLRFDGIEDAPFYANSFKIGEPLSIQWLYSYIGVNKQTGLYEFEDINKDNVLDDLDRKLMNPLDKKYYGGLTNTVQYKGFELLIHWQFSNQPALRYLPRLPGVNFTNQPAEVLARWFTPGDQTDVQRFGTSDGSGAFLSYLRLQQSSFNSEDASFIRLKTLSLGYVLQAQLIKKINLQSVKLFIQGQNLLTITKYKGLDPETGSGLPQLRMITVGLQMR